MASGFHTVSHTFRLWFATMGGSPLTLACWDAWSTDTSAVDMTRIGR